MNDLQRRLDEFESQMEADIAAGEKALADLQRDCPTFGGDLVRVLKAEIKGAVVSLHRFRETVKGEV